MVCQVVLSLVVCQAVLCPVVLCLVVLQVVPLQAVLQVVPRLGVLRAVRYPGVHTRCRMRWPLDPIPCHGRRPCLPIGIWTSVGVDPECFPCCGRKVGDHLPRWLWPPTLQPLGSR